MKTGESCGSGRGFHEQRFRSREQQETHPTKLPRRRHGDANLAESATLMYTLLTYRGSYWPIMSVVWQTGQPHFTVHGALVWHRPGKARRDQLPGLGGALLDGSTRREWQRYTTCLSS